ncbi:MAG TPA: YceD family protein [Mycobacteriales bacterium]
MTPTASITPDPRRPLVLDTRPLGRRPGSMWQESWTAPAPDGLGRDLVRIPTGSDLELDIRLEAALDGVLVTASVSAPTTGECARCLEELREVLEVGFTELYSYPEQTERFARTSGGRTEDDGDVRHLDGDLLDLEQPLRDAVVLALPASPLCGPDCGGLCTICGAKLDDVGDDHTHDEHDPRWASLRGLMQED